MNRRKSLGLMFNAKGRAKAKVCSALEQKSPEQLEKAIHGAGIDVNQPCCGPIHNGQTILRVTMQKNDASLLSALLSGNKKQNLDAGDPLDGNLPIFVAIGLRNDDMVKILVAHGADVNVRDDEMGTPLHEAAEGHLEQATKALIDSKCDLNAIDNDGMTALHRAVINQSSKCVDLLVKGGCDKNMKDLEGKTALHYAVQVEFDDEYSGDAQVEITEMLVDSGCDLNATDDDGNTALHLLAYNGYQTIHAQAKEIGDEEDPSIKKLIEDRVDAVTQIANILLGEEELIDVNVENNVGMTPIVSFLYSEPVENNEGLLTAFIQGGAEVLHIAAFLGNIWLAEKAIENNVEINVNDVNGRTPLHVAALKKNHAMAKFLIEKGADIDPPDSAGLTPLHLVCNISLDKTRKDHMYTLRCLVKKGADVNATDDEDGYTPLHILATLDLSEIVKNCPEDEVQSAMDTVNRMSIHVANFLLENGALIDKEDSEGLTPLQVAMIQRKKLLVALLLEEGATVDPKAIRKSLHLSRVFHREELLVAEEVDHIQEVKQALEGLEAILETSSKSSQS